MNEYEMGRFDKWLAEEMRKRGWDENRMAAESGLTKTTIWHYLRRKRMPNYYALTQILQALGKTILFVDVEESDGR